MLRQVLPYLLLIVLFGCIDPISLKIEGESGALVVDGWITNQQGPYTIKLSRSIPYDNSQPLRVYSLPEKGAKVTIVDDRGNVESLVDKGSGNYATVNLTGQTGFAYQLQIETADGNKYKSTFELLKLVAAIEKLEYEFTVYDRLFINANGDARVLKTEAFFVYATVNDPIDVGDYYRWQAEGIFEFFSLTDFPDIKQCWAPSPSRLESNIELADDIHYNGKSIKQFVAIVPYDRPTNYLVKVQQKSLSEKSYFFYSRLRDQQTNTGSIFDPPSTPVTGNIESIDNKDEIVLGYFGASAVAESSLLINRFQAAGFANPSTNVAIKPGDCRMHEPNATNVKPNGF